ncbi:patatin-like phospholipase family protein [Thioalkalivibrio sp. XN279]|uniref:patatin-like phospholipase family protein n=1 Tax=Thioalkalivibrio sp. XN279 TaxID=2714953 RepID=UPI00140C61DA|nr:patatin-like phospholipase family protein [Thioalkalivibrio sp. XN279]NHA15908.1 serine protease [Thioalkalivibrio sp. XN279]
MSVEQAPTTGHAGTRRRDGKGKRIALVLGSGGARGLAHIGVIQHLEELGHEIVYISGCSMGALVGGIYAAGQLEAYAEWARKLEKRDMFSLLDLAFGWKGLFKGDRLMGVLKELVGEHVIEDLPIGFTAVATDLLEQREIWLNKGPLFDAIRASIAIPTVFTPHPYLGRVLVDGGLLNPIPIAPALNQNADMIIAVNLNAHSKRSRERVTELMHQDGEPAPGDGGATAADAAGEEEQGGPKVPGILDVVTVSLDLMQNSIARMKLASYTPDLVIDVPRDACLFYEFYRAEEMIALGRERAQETLSRQQD